jgi:hypothetical protein
VRPRFQADADLNQTIVLAVLRKEPGIDFRTAVPQSLSPGAAAEEILLIWSVTSAEEWLNRLVYLPI